jgi:hypothetical protein
MDLLATPMVRVAARTAAPTWNPSVRTHRARGAQGGIIQVGGLRSGVRTRTCSAIAVASSYIDSLARPRRTVRLTPRLHRRICPLQTGAGVERTCNGYEAVHPAIQDMLTVCSCERRAGLPQDANPMSTRSWVWSCRYGRARARGDVCRTASWRPARSPHPGTTHQATPVDACWLTCRGRWTGAQQQHHHAHHMRLVRPPPPPPPSASSCCWRRRRPRGHAPPACWQPWR